MVAKTLDAPKSSPYCFRSHPGWAVIQITGFREGRRGEILLWKIKAVAGPGVSHEELRFRRIGFDLLAQPIDEDSHVFEFVAVVWTPNRLQEFAMRDGLIGMRTQVGEQVKFLC